MTRREKVTENIKKNLNKYIKLFKTAKEKGLNEADTRNLIDDFLRDSLNYQVFDITSEYRIKGQYADYCLKANNKPICLVEAKSVATPLKESHLFQVMSYAIIKYFEWFILTNGDCWQLYHFGSKVPVEHDLVVEVCLTDSNTKPKEKAELFYYFAKDSFVSQDTKKYWTKKTAVSPKNICKILLSDKILNSVRLELRRQTGFSENIANLKSMIKKEVIKKSLC